MIKKLIEDEYCIIALSPVTIPHLHTFLSKGSLDCVRIHAEQIGNHLRRVRLKTNRINLATLPRLWGTLSVAATILLLFDTPLGM